MTISIGKLEKLRERCEQGEFDVTGGCIISSREWDVASCDSPSDAECLVAEHNAAPALLAIATAALAYMAANDDQTTHGDEYHRARAHANDVLRQAVAKVTP